MILSASYQDAEGKTQFENQIEKVMKLGLKRFIVFLMSQDRILIQSALDVDSLDWCHQNEGQRTDALHRRK